ncbi:MAG TPA: toprim domain-containing protein [Polyangia bacterium]|nr:toprim domain-containing protein [Polyangia bacterium]
MSVAATDEGRILLRCFAGCDVAAIVEALRLEVRDLFAETPVTADANVESGTVPAVEVPAVATWLRQIRALPEAEANRIFGARTRTGTAAVFRYAAPDGTFLYDKFRLLGDRKVFWRRPRGKPSALYGLADLPKDDRSRVVIVEGELDLHALRAVGIQSVVSVPDGAGSRLTSDLLAPLSAYGRCLIATDADDPGEELARRLRQELGPRRCRRVVFRDGDALFKDANDALKAGWTRERFDAVLEAPAMGTSLSTGAAGDAVMVPGSDEAPGPYRLIDNQICRVRHDREGNESVQALANFDARIFEEVAYDDGAEVVRAFKVRGRLASGAALTDARVRAAEFGGMNWVASAWGARALVSAGAGARDHLRAAIQILSEPVERVVYRHTGWRFHEGRWVYLYQGGGVGAEGLTVELDPPLDRFVLPPVAEEVRDAVTLSLRLLDAAQPSVAIPLLAATYAAPLAFITSPDFALWMVGPTGSLKSELAALAQRHFGTFDRKTLPGSWTSTENALEARLFTVKDAVAVIDDYAPNADSRAQQELEKRAQRIIRGIGNRASRGRLRADLSQQPDRPPRGMVICTGEDLPTGHSIQARLVIVEVDRERLNLAVITELQNRGDRLPHAMRGFIEWLQPAIPTLRKEAPARIARIRNELFQIGSHLRQADALAQLRSAFDLLLEFALDVGAISAVRATELRATARHTLRGIGEAQGTALRDLEPAERFMTVLGTLLEQRRVRLVRKGTSPRADEVETVGWFDDDFAYLLPEAARRRVATFLRESGEAWAHSAHALHKALVRKGFVVPGPDQRPEMQVRVGDGKRRVLRVRLTALQGVRVPDSVPGRSPDRDETGDGADPEVAAEDPGDSEIMSPTSPASRGSEGRYPWDEN